MTWYVALVAILNICLGYALATYLGAGRARNPLPHAATDSQTGQEQEFDDGDEYYADDHYDSDAEVAEYESAVVH